MTPGLLLLTGGRGLRLGAPKHARPHPAGGTWGSHLADTFRSVFPEGPVCILGEPLLDRPQLPVLGDPGQGPAAALVHWARQPREAAPARWWVVACDQVRWTAGTLSAWHAKALEVDPGARSWVMARVDDHTQDLGSFLPGSLVQPLAALEAPSLWRLARDLPCTEVAWPGACWQDVDTPEALAAWLAEGPEK